MPLDPTLIVNAGRSKFEAEMTWPSKLVSSPV